MKKNEPTLRSMPMPKDTNRYGTVFGGVILQPFFGTGPAIFYIIIYLRCFSTLPLPEHINFLMLKSESRSLEFDNRSGSPL